MDLNKEIILTLFKQVGRCLLLPVLLVYNNWGVAQNDTLNKKRLKTVVVIESVTYLSVMTGLNSIWWDGYPTTKFHTFNDNDTWLQMDKVGHGLTGYYVGVLGFESLRWAGVKKNKALLYGGTLGSVFLSSIEVLDGFSEQYGTSWGDVIANSAGTIMFIAQEVAWDEQRLLFKYSYHQSEYIDVANGNLGENIVDNAISDYNGQTYWISGNIASFLDEDTKFPKWLNVAVGYGADGLIGASENPSHLMIDRKRQYYISLDLDLARIKTKSKLVNTVFKAFGFIKIPLPTIEFNEGGDVKFYTLYH